MKIQVVNIDIAFDPDNVGGGNVTAEAHALADQIESLPSSGK